jgi:hypothetical protein
MAAADAFLTDELRAVRAVLLELAEILSEYRAGVVVTGGVIPLLLLPPEEGVAYRSTNDVDLVLDLTLLQTLEDDNSDTIHDILFQNLYQQDERKPYRYHRGVWTGRRTVSVPVDLLAGERYRTEDRAVHDRVRATQEIYASPLYGVDLALLAPTEYRLSGMLPDGRERSDVPIRVADLALFVAIKAIAFTDRLRAYRAGAGTDHEDEAAKHAFDLYECVRRYPGGVPALAARLAPHQGNAMVQDALARLRDAFASPTADGPRLVTREDKYADEPEESQHFLRQDAYQRVKRLLDLLTVSR